MTLKLPHIVIFPLFLAVANLTVAAETIRFSTADRIARITGNTSAGENLPNSNDTAGDYNIGGTDLGIIWLMKNGEYGVFFGDTYGRNHTGDGSHDDGDWRCNVLLFSKDNHPEDGFTFSGVAADSSGASAREIIHGGKDKSGNGDWTSIPTGAICADGKEYVHYMNIKKWVGWVSNYSAICRSTDSGRNWTKCEGVRFASRSNFGQVGYYKKDGYIYMIGTVTGRRSSPRLARFKETDIENQRAYEYWNNDKKAWIKGFEQEATNLFEDTTGELSFIYHNRIKKWILVYFCAKRYNISVRYADEITGPWSEPQALATGAQYPQLYGSYLHPSSSDGDTLYFLMSMWKPYNVFLMKSKITCEN